ncbi:MAG: hypothetical protein FWG39_01055 [Alphaproteobacteria bacterium]|nr:hypothetical protein [Alphaproteobacteria bacterium]
MSEYKYDLGKGIAQPVGECKKSKVHDNLFFQHYKIIVGMDESFTMRMVEIFEIMKEYLVKEGKEAITLWPIGIGPKPRRGEKFDSVPTQFELTFKIIRNQKIQHQKA